MAEGNSIGRRRDRHDRGVRGPLALPNLWTRRPVRPPRLPQRQDLFDAAVTTSISRVQRHCPPALRGIEFGIEEVPPPQAPWVDHQIPLAAAIEPVGGQPARVVIYRRPLEHRAASRQGLKILVHRTIVEQLSALTGISVEELDPTGYADRDDED
ncbi:metallopeptidase family protein [Propionibacteriaceae bacterium Y1700]|uniref:metallopeptidase family protein n=1 Tax=Microlunatus sp. Y1700 TaxID=3418487 RepID=UPI003DA79BDA